MTNHVHLLVTPDTETGIAKLMQAVGRHYVQYINRSYRCTGSLWEGRYKSSVIQAEAYLLTCMRHIELNSVRTGMVQAPGQYRWSSYRRNGFGQPDPRITTRSISPSTGMEPTGKPPTVPCSAANWMKKPLATFGLPCHRDSRWDMAISATKSVRRWGSSVRRNDLGNRQANQINSVIQKYKPILDS